MDERHGPEFSNIPRALQEQIEELCGQFEEAWKADNSPKIEAFLERLLLPDRAPLLRELLLTELAYCAQTGSLPPIDEYLSRFPNYRAVVEGAFDLALKARNTPPSANAETVSLSLDLASPYIGQLYSPGDSIGRYTIQKELGRGTFGIVYLAHDTALDHPVALKVARRDQFLSTGSTDQFWDEARTVFKLKHPGIAAVYNVGRTEDDTPYVVMEYINGQTLRDLIEAGPLPPSRVVELLVPVADALQHAHRCGFVHRDLKPGNILLDAEGRPHVADFGLALHEDQQRERPGESAGTPAYMAPEQVRRESHRLDGRADLWALGVILYEMLTGRRPFGGEAPAHVKDEILHREPRPPRMINAQIPEELERVCLKCLAKDVTARYATAADVARDLQRWAMPRPLRRRLLWAGVAVLALLLLAVTAWQFAKLPRGGDDAPARSGGIRAKLDIRVWKADDPSCRNVSVGDPRARPLRPGDLFSIQAELSRPAYLYLVGIDGRGQASPLYPWQPDKWHTLPAVQKPVERVTLPDGERLGTIKPPRGMETLLLLAAENPMTDDRDLATLLTGLPPQPVGSKRIMLSFTNGQRDTMMDVTTPEGANRSFDISDTKMVDDEVLRTQMVIHRGLSKQFPLVRTVTVANSGE